MIYYANSEWSPLKSNPFSVDGQYGESWSAFIYDEEIQYYSNVVHKTKVYCLKVSPDLDKDFQRIIDFVKYETYHKRNVIIKVHKKLRPSIEAVLRNNFADNDTAIRETDPRWVVHSTTKDSWEEIKKSGFLYSPSELKRMNILVKEIGLKELVEPKDYSDYIMFDILNGCGEIVVNSRQLGYVCTKPDIPYNPGVRLYFDAYKIIKDGLAVRDGLHIIKVKEKLHFQEYLAMAVTADISTTRELWTPTTYTEWANRYFLNNVTLLE
ncbi:hypothetical protein [Clostridium cellulovorans]|uniref:Uncharacterized protein n=1 Tax=Clostridium cellulovorans (strain ATCC 35296 / DSM 3052 / OCM 3 / 743B) TaxID=573061 RepID=D9SVA4_CLOC7|nr:hypothetical protein [Clostridium cellulovorans]ADL53078.1 hypothetical protein Clocel_3399 [Clostridium cellulovorans 743B]